jgi:hypothetical protein
MMRNKRPNFLKYLSEFAVNANKFEKKKKKNQQQNKKNLHIYICNKIEKFNFIVLFIY